MLSTLILGIVSSWAAELVAWLNKRFTGTALQGDGAFIASLLAAVILAIGKLVIFPNIPTAWWTIAGSIFAVSQIYFNTIAKWLNLKVE